MKCKSLVLMLVLAVAAWGQTAAQGGSPQHAASHAKAKCACCQKTASGTKDGQSCARKMTQSADGKSIASSCCDDKNEKLCCGKDAQCMKGDQASCCSRDGKDKTASSCCGSDCAKSCGKACCSGKSEKASRSSCRKVLQS